MSSESEERILAIVVTYQPDDAALRELLGALAPQVDDVLVVDNTPASDDRVHATIASLQGLGATLRLVRFGANAGIGTALNVGIGVALAEGFDYVLLSDQDSVPASDMVAQLLGVAHELLGQGVRVGYVGGAYMDRNTGHSFGFQVHEPGRFFYSTRASDRADPWTEIITGITSGSLYPSEVFAEVGLMREDWFIDYVDTEWCHRARYFGRRLFGTSRAVLGHSLGERSFPVWYGRWRPYSGYSPQRLYYRFRNFVLLLKCGYVPWRWKLRATWYWLGNLYAYAFFSPQRSRNIRYIVRGLLDGVCGRTGRIDDARRP